MKASHSSYRSMAIVLLLLVAAGTALRNVVPSESEGSRFALLVWNAFLFGIPLVLAGLLIAEIRWALMAGVIYGTIGLALDISTLVQELTGGDVRYPVLVLSLATGLLNFLLIVFGGRGFLAVVSDVRPPR